MSHACCDGSGDSGGQPARRPAATPGTADWLALWLALAAAPTFAIMALMVSLPGGDPAGMICAAAHGSPLNGMATMYLLMCAFHAGPWVKLAWRRTAL
ncbi:hypothetical protein [Mesorhizobium sp. A556]